MSAKTTPFQQLTAEAARLAGRDTDKIADEFDLKRRPYAIAIVHKHAGIVR
jgi:hypothetical protein